MLMQQGVVPMKILKIYRTKVSLHKNFQIYGGTAMYVCIYCITVKECDINFKLSNNYDCLRYT